MHLSKKATIISLILITLIGLGVLGYNIWLTNKQDRDLVWNPQVNHRENFRGLLNDLDSKGWVTYRDERHGFELKIPEDFSIKRGGQGENPNKIVLVYDNSLITLYIHQYSKLDSYKISYSDFRFFVTDQLGTLTRGELRDKDIKTIERNINGNYALEVLFPPKFNKFINTEKASNNLVVWHYIFRKGYIYQISTIGGFKELSQQNFQKQIVATLKFIR